MNVFYLSGALLDLWVARAEGVSAQICEDDGRCRYSSTMDRFCPSVDWTLAGPIICREGISISVIESPRVGAPDGRLWSSTIFLRGPHPRTVALHEREPLVAAMRVFVASRFGAEVPDEVPADAVPGDAR